MLHTLIVLCLFFMACSENTREHPTPVPPDTGETPGRDPADNFPTDVALPLKHIPKEADIIEQMPIPSNFHPHRALVLWMPSSTRYPHPQGKPYTCADNTRGSYYRGPARVSLLDTGADTVINTLRIPEWRDGIDTFDIPFRIRGGLHYYAPAATEQTEGKPVILYLYDYNGDGLALEFALFDAVGCTGLKTALIGYIPKRDSVVWYAVKLAVTRGVRTTTEIYRWTDYLFSKNPVAPGEWEFTVTDTLHGGAQDNYKFSYDLKKMRFHGQVTIQ